MIRLLNAWMTMENREYCRVRRRQHQSEWLQLCRQSTVTGKGVCYLQCIFLIIKVRIFRMQRY